jgi:hypothetical protein
LLNRYFSGYCDGVLAREEARVLAAEWCPQVGESVRVRDGVGEWIACPNLPHFTAEAGHVGTIVAVQALATVSDHPFLVMFTEPVPLVCMIGKLLPLSARHYALGELERIDG